MNLSMQDCGGLALPRGIMRYLYRPRGLLCTLRIYILMSSLSLLPKRIELLKYYKGQNSRKSMSQNVSH